MKVVDSATQRENVGSRRADVYSVPVEDGNRPERETRVSYLGMMRALSTVHAVVVGVGRGSRG